MPPSATVGVMVDALVGIGVGNTKPASRVFCSRFHAVAVCAKWGVAVGEIVAVSEIVILLVLSAELIRLLGPTATVSVTPSARISVFVFSTVAVIVVDVAVIVVDTVLGKVN